jgi:hypothetical protein
VTYLVRAAFFSTEVAFSANGAAGGGRSATLGATEFSAMGQLETFGIAEVFTSPATSISFLNGLIGALK